MRKTFQIVADYLSGYSSDSKIFRQYTGLELDRATYDGYSQKGTTLRSVLKEAEKDDVDGYGMPLQIARTHKLALILTHMGDNGVIFNLSDKANEPLLNRLTQSAHDLMAQNMYPSMPSYYKKAPELLKVVNNMRAKVARWEPLTSL